VPGASQGIGKKAGYVEAVKASRLPPVVGEYAPERCLCEEQERYNAEKRPSSPLTGRKLQNRGSGMHDMGDATLTLPTQVVELTDDEEDQPQPG